MVLCNVYWSATLDDLGGIELNIFVCVGPAGYIVE